MLYKTQGWRLNSFCASDVLITSVCLKRFSWSHSSLLIDCSHFTVFPGVLCTITKLCPCPSDCLFLSSLRSSVPSTKQGPACQSFACPWSAAQCCFLLPQPHSSTSAPLSVKLKGAIATCLLFKHPPPQFSIQAAQWFPSVGFKVHVSFPEWEGDDESKAECHEWLDVEEERSLQGEHNQLLNHLLLPSTATEGKKTKKLSGLRTPLSAHWELKLLRC